MEPVETKPAESEPKSVETKIEEKTDVKPIVEAEKKSEEIVEEQAPKNKLITVGRRSSQLPTYAKQLQQSRALEASQS